MHVGTKLREGRRPAVLASNLIIISQGDAAGAGWFALKEIITKQKKYNKLPIRDLVVVGDVFENDKAFVAKYFQSLDYSEKLTLPEKRTKPIFVRLKSSSGIEPGKGNALVALRSYHAFQKALKLFQNIPESALVTLPVSKELIMKAGVDFTGHTAELGKAFLKRVFMCMYHKKFSVIPLTEHIPLAQVSRKLYEVNVDALGEALHQYREIFSPKKKTAWCGVNPHCGENGRVGTEEEFVRRSIETLSRKGLTVEGPISADAVFTKHVLPQYSLVLANYHDQGLIPFKSIIGMAGVNTTLGLPQLRVSPDHGTAFQQTAANAVDVTGVLASLQFAAAYSGKWVQASQ